MLLAEKLEEEGTMQQTALITGADKGLGLTLAGRFIEGGWHVFAGSYFSGVGPSVMVNRALR
jgi:hypothetical protein